MSSGIATYRQGVVPIIVALIAWHTAKWQTKAVVRQAQVSELRPLLVRWSEGHFRLSVLRSIADKGYQELAPDGFHKSETAEEFAERVCKEWDQACREFGETHLKVMSLLELGGIKQHYLLKFLCMWIKLFFQDYESFIWQEFGKSFSLLCRLALSDSLISSAHYFLFRVYLYWKY